MRRPACSGQFKRDVNLAKRRGKDMAKLKAVLTLLIDGTPLPGHYLDHR
jgi:mRNA interferase YafQ